MTTAVIPAVYAIPMSACPYWEAPRTDVDVDRVNATTVMITHEGGEPIRIPANRIEIHVDRESTPIEARHLGGDSVWEPGERLVVRANPGTEIRVIAQQGPPSDPIRRLIYRRHDCEGIPNSALIAEEAPPLNETTTSH